MGVIGVYFRRHRWQRRVLIALLVLIFGLLAGIALQPVYFQHRLREVDRELLARLDSPDARTRQQTIEQLVHRAKQFPATLRRVRGAIHTEDDERFWCVYSVLRRCPGFKPAELPPETFDRIRLIELRDVYRPRGTTTQPASRPASQPTTRPATRPGEDRSASAATRRLLVAELLLGGRENRYVRQAAPLAAADPAAAVRLAAAPLAAKLGEDGLLRDLLGDADPQVVTAAAFSAGSAGRDDLAADIEALLFRTVPQLQQAAWQEDSTEAEALRDVAGAAAAALAMLRPGRSAEMLCELTRQTTDEPLADRLLMVLPLLDGPEPGRTVLDRLQRGRFEGTQPAGMDLWAAAAMNLHQAGPFATDVLRVAAKGESGLMVSQIIGGLDVLAASGWPARGLLYEVVENLWYPDRPVMLSRAARLLGAQASSDEYQPPDAPDREACRSLLVRACQYTLVREIDGQEQTVTTPLASASAAVALWLLDPSVTEFDLPETTTRPAEVVEMTLRPNSAFYLRETIITEDVRAGETIAWLIGRSGREQAGPLGELFLPPPGSDRREYNPAVRTTGALLQALSARTDDQRQAVRQRLAEVPPGADFADRAGRLCARYIAGDEAVLPEVRELLEYREYPAQRVLLALLAGGDRQCVDWLLWDTHWMVESTPEDLVRLLVFEGFDDVFADVLPGLPRPPAAAGPGAQRWAVRWMQCLWGVGRNRLAMGLRR